MWSSLQRTVSNTLQNWDVQRPYSARLDERIHGFTEEWDTDDSNNDEDEHRTVSSTISHPRQHDAGSVEHQPPVCNVRLFQYRPAWLEQLVLRVSKIPHVLINSPYAVMEVAGPLPFLQDFDGGSLSRDTNENPPAMVGRYQIIDGDIPQNAILDYLKLHRGVDLDSVLVDQQQIQKSATFVAILRDTLNPCLVALRYRADPIAWEQIYRSQCISATSGSSNHWMCRPMLAMWQAWSEKVHSVSNMSDRHRRLSKEAIIEKARCTYAIFEHHLEANQSDTNQYLLATDKPTIVDCLLWDHIMQALADIHLVILLADFPALLKFTQNVWDKFSFGTIIEDVNVQGSSVWVWNMEENAMNAFARIPLIPETIGKEIESDVVDHTGIDMINKLSMLQNDLRKSLALAKQLRSTKSYQVYRNQPWATWHRWRMGGGFLPSTGTSNESTTTEESSRRQYQRNDEIWMMSVVTTAVIAMVGFGLVG